MSTQTVLTLPEAGLRRMPTETDVCEFCHIRLGKKIRAVAVVAGSPMCDNCFKGTPTFGRVPVIVDGKTQRGCASEKYAKDYAKLADLISGKKEEIVVYCDSSHTLRKLQANLVRKSVRLGVRVTSRSSGNKIVLRVKQV